MPSTVRALSDVSALALHTNHETHGGTSSSSTSTVTSPKRLARIAGVLYLLVGITGGFAEGFVEPKVYVPATRRPPLRPYDSTQRWSS